MSYSDWMGASFLAQDGLNRQAFALGQLNVYDTRENGSVATFDDHEVANFTGSEAVAVMPLARWSCSVGQIDSGRIWTRLDDRSNTPIRIKRVDREHVDH
jgi:hypothetical protein